MCSDMAAGVAAEHFYRTENDLLFWKYISRITEKRFLQAFCARLYSQHYFWCAQWRRSCFDFIVQCKRKLDPPQIVSWTLNAAHNHFHMDTAAVQLGKYNHSLDFSGGSKSGSSKWVVIKSCVKIEKTCKHWHCNSTNAKWQRVWYRYG